MIVAHGSGTRQSDASEALAIRRVFGATAPPVTAFKWAFGHPLAASGILDSVLALIALRHGVVPGVAPLRELDPDLGDLPVSARPQAPRSDVALVLNRGFGGSNTALVLRGDHLRQVAAPASGQGAEDGRLARRRGQARRDSPKALAAAYMSLAAVFAMAAPIVRTSGAVDRLVAPERVVAGMREKLAPEADLIILRQIFYLNYSGHD